MKQKYKNNSKVMIVLLLPLVAICHAQIKDQDTISGLYANLPFPMEKVVRPVFPDNIVTIIDFGAVGDGQTSNTTAIKASIEALEKKGGGTIIIPEGIWLTGPIQLKSNMNLHVEKGAIIIFSKNYQEYPLVKTWYEGLASWRAMAPIYAEHAENIAITGEGIFDGSGEIWRPVKKYLMTDNVWKSVINSGGAITSDGKTWYPDSSSLKESLHNIPHGEMDLKHANDVKTFLRPVMLELVNCKKVLIDSVTFQNSPSWCLHPLLSENISISNVKVLNEEWMVNGDALDLESCKNTLIYNCIFDAGDDAICMKSGRDAEGRRRGAPTENVIISNCTVYHGHGGFVIGSEMSGGVRNIQVSHCSFIGTDNGLRFKSTRGRGGLVENIYVSNINMINIRQDAILFDLYYFVKEHSTDIPQADETTPQFRNIYLKNIFCKGAERAILLQGLPEMNLSNINLKNITIESRTGAFISDARDINIKHLTLSTPSSPAIWIEDASNLILSHLKLVQAKTVQLEGAKTNNISIESPNITSDDLKISPSINPATIKLNQK